MHCWNCRVRQIMTSVLRVCVCVCGIVIWLEISRVWLETLLDIMELLPKEIISKEVSLLTVFVSN